MSLSDKIKNKALELGFDIIGITDASDIGTEQTEAIKNWLDAGFAGQMNYMHRNLQKRTNPANLLENAQSVIVAGLNSKPPQQNQQETEPRQKNISTHTHTVEASEPAGRVARYALYEDYHQFIKQRLYVLSDFISSLSTEQIRSKVCVDSVPLAERALAVRAGLGFIGKNHMLIHPKLGPEIFLGEIITTLKLQCDKPIAGNCGKCTKCIDTCPTGALKADGRFAADKCINYLTIEYKGEIPPEAAKKIGNRLFGCDECVRVCPYQKKAPARTNTQLKYYPQRADIPLMKISELSEEAFEAEFSNSSLKRTGLNALKRNARICLQNLK